MKKFDLQLIYATLYHG